MSHARYRIAQVTIEGFRGFTEPQTIQVDGKNMFVFGVNGQGKSSIIEAIRWGLFGGQGSQEIEVRNTFYSKAECAVAIELVSDEGRIEVRRELRPGMNSSRQKIRDAEGNSVAEKDVLPELARIGHQEGTQVIFAAQHAGGRQAQVDITNFTRVLCFYLRLEKVPDLIEILSKLVTEREEELKRAAQEVESAGGKIRNHLETINNQIEEILRNPPWGEGPAPSGFETERKVALLVEDAASTKGIIRPNGGGSPMEALAHVKRELDRVGAQKINDLQAQHQKLTNQAAVAENAIAGLTQARANQASAVEKVQETETQREVDLGGETLEAICKHIGELERAMTESAAKADLGNRAKKLCAEYGWSQCPVCGTQHAPVGSERTLVDRIGAQVDGLANTGPDPAALEGLRGRAERIERINLALSLRRKALDAANIAEVVARSQLVAEMPEGEVSGDPSKVKARVDELRRAAGIVSGEIADSQGQRTVWGKRVKDLEQEIVYHGYRDRKQSLENRLTDGMTGPRNLLRQYQELLNTTKSLQEMLEREFDLALEKARPPLEHMLTEVYQRLTRQPSYNLVRIFAPPEQRRKRELRVASSQLPGQMFSPSVLNGQAAKALRLVPYFVFSQFQPEIMELELLLIDDPSESFDTSHVSDLVGELARAAQHAQLFVATHEQEKFEPHFQKHFGPKIPVQLFVEGFSTMGGPKLASR
jgi:AAA domain